MQVADSPIRPQDAIGVPGLVRAHDLFQHDVLVRQQPQEAQLRDTAERELLVLKVTEPVPRSVVKGV